MDVTLRRVRCTDLERLNEIVNDPEVAHYLALIPPVSMKSTYEFYDRIKKNRWGWYCIIADGKVVGAVGLMVKAEKNKQSHVAEVGIDIAKEYWGKGIGLKAFRHITREARERGIRRLELQVVRENRRARRLYEKAGFKREGVKKRAFKINGRYHDTVMMAKLI
jgi:putative acetyltransferase